MRRECPACGSQVLDTITTGGSPFFVDPEPVDGENVKLDFEYSPPRASPARPVEGEKRYRAHHCSYRPVNNVDIGMLLLAEAAYETSRDRGTVTGPKWHDLDARARRPWIKMVADGMERSKRRQRGLLDRVIHRVLGKKG